MGTPEGYSPNDIALVVTQELISEADASPGILNSDTSNPGPGTAMITGWGRTCSDCSLSEVLLKSEMNIMTDTECIFDYGSWFDSKHHICLGDGTMESGAICNGDSGGPMSIGNVIYGTTSWSSSRCQANRGSVYAKVATYHEWLCSLTDYEAAGC